MREKNSVTIGEGGGGKRRGVGGRRQICYLHCREGWRMNSSFTVTEAGGRNCGGRGGREKKMRKTMPQLGKREGGGGGGGRRETEQKCHSQCGGGGRDETAMSEL